MFKIGSFLLFPIIITIIRRALLKFGNELVAVISLQIYLMVVNIIESIIIYISRDSRKYYAA